MEYVCSCEEEDDWFLLVDIVKEHSDVTRRINIARKMPWLNRDEHSRRGESHSPELLTSLEPQCLPPPLYRRTTEVS